MTIPGVAAKGATALLAAVGEDPRLLKNGRGLAAWLGLVPRQHATGGRERLLGISKRGDVYLRNLLIHGARAVLRCVERKEDRTSRWAKALKARRHTNVAVVAMANKIARVAYGVILTGKPYDPAGGLPLARTAARTADAPTTRDAKSEPHCDGMKGMYCIPENLRLSPASLAETDTVIRTGMHADSIRARGPTTEPHNDAGYMTATASSCRSAGCSCIAGRTIYERYPRGRRTHPWA